MLAFYLAALVLGLGVVLLQFVAPGSEADGAGHDLEHEHPAGDWGAVAVFISLRFWSFALLTFGLVASLFTLFELAAPLTTVLVAATLGLGAGLLAASSLRYLGRNTVSSGGDADDVLGKVGRVLVSIQPGKRGKIRIDARGRLLDLVASSDAEALEVGASVVVDALSGTTARVSRADPPLGKSTIP